MRPQLDTDTRDLADGSTLARDRECNALSASGGAARVLLACARHVTRLAPESASGWWRGEAQLGESGLAKGRDAEIELRDGGAFAQVSLALLQWAIEGAYAEHLGDFTRWMFTAPPRACIPGEGDREAAEPLEGPLAAFTADVTAKALSPQIEAARRRSLIAQIDAFALLSEPMLAEKRDALIAMGCSALARWTEAARALDAYYTSPTRAQFPADQLGPPDMLHGVLSLDFPDAAPVPDGMERERWWVFCETNLVRAERGALADDGFMITSSGKLTAKLFFRNEDGKRRALYKVLHSLR